MLSLAVSFATWQANHEILYRKNVGLRRGESFGS